MTDIEGQDSGPAYSPKQLAELAKILGISEPSAELVDRLQRATLIYQFLNEGDEMRATRRERRKAFKQVALAARNLVQKVDTLLTMLIEDRGTLPLVDTRKLEELAEAADEAAAYVPDTGANPRTWRRRMVEDLGKTYLDATGKRPTLQRNLHNEAGGTFFEFVQTAIKPFDQHAAQTVETDVRAVVAAMKKLGP